MHTCLFTERPLGEDTREEHTIPRGLCGRIRSRTVSSNEFNQRCGNRIDPHLLSPFDFIRNKLAPLLSSEHQPGPMPVEVDGQDTPFVLKPGGVLSQSGLGIEKDPVSGHPVSVTADTEAEALRFARKSGMTVTHFRDMPGPQIGEVRKRTALVSREIEIGALKCALLSFDHALDEYPDRFTRRPDLRVVRSLVNEAIMESFNDMTLFTQHVWGVDYELCARIDKWRQECAMPESEFEHVLIASGNAATRTFDVVWIIFGFEPYRFRVSFEWNGGGRDITILLACGVLKNTTVSTPTFFDEAFDLGPKSNLRAAPDVDVSQESAEQRSRLWVGARLDAFRRATYLVETKADDELRKQLTKNTASLPYVTTNQPGRLDDAIRDRLCNHFGSRIDKQDHLRVFEGILDNALRSLNTIAGQQTIGQDGRGGENVDWTVWLDVYRTILEALRPSFGLPGELGSRGTYKVREPIDGRDLGILPQAEQGNPPPSETQT